VAVLEEERIYNKEVIVKEVKISFKAKIITGKR